MKRLKLLTFTFFAALLLFTAIGKSVLSGRELLDVEALVMPVEVDDKVEEPKEAHTHAACPQEKALTEKKPDGNNTNLLKKEPASENLSFNFIYYILYKFKYIDIFGLVRPSK